MGYYDKPFFCPDVSCSGKPHEDWDYQHARPPQRPPSFADYWPVWAVVGGRGSGKTRAGSEVTHEAARVCRRIALVGRTLDDVEDIMIDGESGLLNTAKPGHVPVWNASTKKLTWPNGCVAWCFSSDPKEHPGPDDMPGLQFEFAWADEPPHWIDPEVWDSLKRSVRIGIAKIIADFTPEDVPWTRDLLSSPFILLSHMTTRDNEDNLTHAYLDAIYRLYEGTELGRVQLDAEFPNDDRKTDE